MSKLVQRLKTAWHFWKFFPHVEIPPGYWTDPDARALSNFLCSDTGVKLRYLWVQRLHQEEKRAIMDSSGTKYTNGIAWGVRALIAETDELLQISPPASELSALTERQLEGEFRSVNR